MQRLCCLIHKTFECIFCDEPFCVECWVACNKFYGELDYSFDKSLCPKSQQRHSVGQSRDEEEEYRFASIWSKIMDKERGKIKEFWNE